MKEIRIADTTLCPVDGKYSFREKLEIARQLERLNVDVIELPEITDTKADILLVRTISSFVKNSILSVAVGSSRESLESAVLALGHAEHARIRVELPVSPVGMEYTSHKKPEKMLDWIGECVGLAREFCDDVEFCALDATRAEPEFLSAAFAAALKNGASCLSLCDSAGNLLPDDFRDFTEKASEACGEIPFGVSCSDVNGLAAASAILAAGKGRVSFVKTSVGGEGVSLLTFCDIIKNLGNTSGLSSAVRYTELYRIVSQISRITQGDNHSRSGASRGSLGSDNSGIVLDGKDDRAAVSAAVTKLGYDLSDEDMEKVYEEFRRVAEKKNMGAKELDAIVASVALQVPSTYQLDNYVINNGNIISSSAQITLTKDGKTMQGICIGDGPIDAAFRAVEQIIGTHYELDDFQIQSVTEGKEAVGSAVVKLRSAGKLYSGTGISTDIIGAGIRAYLAAVNKIVYEEE